MAVCIRCRSVLVPEARFCPFCGLPVPPSATPRNRIGAGSEVVLAGLGRAVLGHVIGEGGMGVVYRGTLHYDPAGRLGGTPPHPIALKVLHPLIRGKPRAERLFRHEADILARLSHPNIVHCFGLFEHEHELCIAMELVQGESLSELLMRVVTSPRTLPLLSFAQAWHYFAQLLGALESIHALGIVHRDVKSANVLIRLDGIAKLTDFGIARLPAELARESGGMAPGTGAYMAPEQVSGQPLDARADLYAAAIVLYEMLTGTTPFDAPDRSELMVRAAQLDEAPPPVTRIVPNAPPALDLVFARALAKHREFRYENARALGEAFRTALGVPETAGWRAQGELAHVARTLSMAIPAFSDPASEPAPASRGRVPTTAPDPQAGTVTRKLPTTEPDPASSGASAAAALANADRYRTDVLTAFKRPG